ncbi:MAG: TolC family protein [Cytophagales bacterium]|jgi:outer membrane protein|nr:TolC family protein [Cytophagales bacterium]MCA6378723.1 TolC family protein [Cytophagales bacterium]MCA6387766.1 TolC family protein [Cytophagales bacterium]MCA6390573.1 TolC family protein [Cytophagales bacterium]MCA6396899.1 TolC family protein [Cytophagales bacterium]
MSKKFTATLVFVFLFCLSFAQNGKKVYTLKECVEIALQNNLTVKRSALGLKGADITLDQSRYTMLPSLNVSGSGGANFGRSIDPTTNLFIDQQINNANANANASLLLFNAFRVMNTIKQSVNDKAAAENDLTKAKNDVILSVITFYTSVIFNQELLQNAQFQLKTTQQQLERTKKLEQAGSVPLGNVLDLEAQNATNELNLIQRENNYNLSLLQLKQSLQLPASTQMEVEIPELSVEDLSLDQTTEQIYDIAKQNLPEIKAAVFRTESANFALKAARGSLYPRLNLNASAFTNYSSAAKLFQNGVVDPSPVIGYLGNDQTQVVRSFRPTTIGGEVVEKPFSNQISDNIAQSVSIGLTIPVFNAFNARANVLRNKVTKEQAFINLTDVENRLRQAIETAHNDATAAAKTYASSAKAVKAREEAFRMTKQRYDAGASNYVDYQVSENNLFQAKSDQVRAKYDLIFKKKVLDFYQGKPIDY